MAALSSEKGPGANSDRGLFRGREIPADYNFILTIASCSSSLHGAFKGMSVELSVEATSPFSRRYPSSSSPLMSGSIVPLTITQGESGWPSAVPSQSEFRVLMMSFF